MIQGYDTFALYCEDTTIRIRYGYLGPMSTLDDYLLERIKEKLPEPLLRRIPKDFLFPLFRDSALREEIERTREAYRRENQYKPYTSSFNQGKKNTVKERDNYSCQICGAPEEESKPLSIHHINYSKKDSHLNNLISLCPSCHPKTNGDREQWEYKLYKRLLWTSKDESKLDLKKRTDAAVSKLCAKKRNRSV